MAKKSKEAVAQAMEVEIPEYRPHLEITEKMYPKLKNLKVDETVEMNLRVKVTSINREEWGDKKLRASAVILDAQED